MMLDPVIVRVVAFCMAVLFLTSGWHKLVSVSRFKAIVRDYQIMPDVMVLVVAPIIPLVELALGLLWLLQLEPTLTIAASMGLLTVYCLAIGINLLRGRSHISCGCELSASSNTEQPLSAALIIRNSLLIMILAICLLPGNGRELLWVDHVAVLLATIMGLVLYGSCSQLLNNKSAIASWRTSWSRH